MEKKKALALFSGGLDSILAVELIRRQGIDVVGLHIKTGFFSEDVKQRLGLLKPQETPAIRAAQSINLPLIEVDISDSYCDVIANPRYGYGKHANPCIDCKIKFFKTAKELMEKEGFDFLITGEVLNQRPKSQRIDTLKVIEKESNLEGWVVRPLSAKLLPPSIPEQKGWVDREKLLDIKGKSREKQLQLAKELGLSYIPQPSGGCLLTMEEIGNRIFDHLKHNQWNCEIAELIPIGRHFRLPSGLKVIIARNKEEANYLKSFSDRWLIMKTVGKGTVAVILSDKEPSKEDIEITAALVARYSKNTEREVELVKNDNVITKFKAKPLKDEMIGQLRLKPIAKNKT